MKQVFIIHGWDGYPEEGWFPWLKKELELRGFSVVVPQLPQSEEPRIRNWVPEVQRIVGVPNKDTYFVGHSMGCQTIIRYLEGLPDGIKIGGAVFVAGFLKRLTNLEDDDTVKDVEKEWLSTPLDLKRVSFHLSKSIAIFSDNDPYVPLENKKDFKEQLNSELIIEREMGHFSGSTGTKELPIVLESLLKITS
ncbi:MAG: alpha/beta hydrolase [Patescibacteria group bacterium]